MTGLLARARFILGAVAVAGLIAFAAPVARPTTERTDRSRRERRERTDSASTISAH